MHFSVFLLLSHPKFGRENIGEERLLGRTERRQNKIGEERLLGRTERRQNKREMRV
jgi:hypothetical protein